MSAESAKARARRARTGVYTDDSTGAALTGSISPRPPSASAQPAAPVAGYTAVYQSAAASDMQCGSDGPSSADVVDVVDAAGCGGACIGGIVAGAVGLLLIILLGVWWMKSKSKVVTSTQSGAAASYKM